MTEDEHNLVRTMIRESGKMWLEVRDRSFRTGNGVIICRDPENAFYLERAENYPGAPEGIDGWVIEERPLKMIDAEGFFAAFGNHWRYWIGATFKGQPLRAYIKNGRHQDWSISLGEISGVASA